MRKTKEAQERRNEILDVAEALFNEQGYDATSTNDILRKVGIARGPCIIILKVKKQSWTGLLTVITKK
ncbi:TetR family transcriptional regulator [Virgibacillus saliphilus]|uniref:TetR family transcriptional regulator n=1 Tax=Virgibacillus saliphilus TaxID=2831674 RepID=UPI0021040EB4|nr:TetR family transcriptional regulator [Virgibacillus sp. NKC19-3]